MADTTIDLLKNSSYVGKMDELIAAVKSGGGATSDVEWDNVKNKPITIGGYGITDAKIENGTITLGNQTITPLTSAPVTSVNSKTGAVTLSAADVSAIPSTLTGTAGQVLTKTADGQEWKDVDIPEALPNPNALTFTGAVTGSYDGSAPLSVEIPAGGGSMEMELLAELQGDGEATSFSATFNGIEKPGLYLLRFMVKGADAENTGNNLYAKFGGSGIWGNGIRSLSIATVNNQYDIKVHIMLIITDGLGNAYVASGAERSLNDSVEAPDSENKIIDGVVSLYSQNSKPVFSGASVMLWRLL